MKAKSKIILASNSPRRSDLLKQAGIGFAVDASSADEVFDEHLELHERLKSVARAKALPIHQKYPEDVVISADTTVILDGVIYGKPKDREDAKDILLTLSGRTHSVFTAVCMYFGDEEECFVDETKVTFRDIRPMLAAYLDSNEWNGKAGAYAIQGLAEHFVERLDGDLDNVIGLPLTHVVEVLKNHESVTD